MDDVALGVTEDLDLDVLRVDHRTFDVHPTVTEGGGSLAGCLGGLGAQFLGGADEAHPSSATTGDGLDEQRVGASLGIGDQLVEVLAGLGVVQDRQAGLAGGFHRRGLVAGQIQSLRRRPDEGQSVLGALTCQRRVLGEEPVSGVDGVRPGLHRGADDLVGVEVRLDRRTFGADAHGFVGEGAVEGVAVLAGIHRDGGRTGLVGGAEGADGDLAAVGDDDLSRRSRWGAMWCASFLVGRGWSHANRLSHWTGWSIRQLMGFKHHRRCAIRSTDLGGYSGMGGLTPCEQRGPSGSGLMRRTRWALAVVGGQRADEGVVSFCSTMWAVQPTTRAITKIGVKNGMSMPSM